MILTCPECATRYQTDAAKFPPQGRNVRCAKCGHVWHQSPQQPESDDEAAAPAPAAPTAPVYERTETPPDSASRYEEPAAAPFAPMVARVEEAKPASGIAGRLGLAVGWLLFIAVILAIGWAGLTYRQQIASAWPQSASLYSSMGMPVNTRGLEIQNVRDKMEAEDGQPVLVITGDLVNVSEENLPVPQKIRIGLSDEQKREIYSQTFAPSVTTLAPGQSTSFSTRLANPPAAGRNVEVRFVRAGE